MKFFFPDSHDHVDPSFDFIKETSNPNRIPQRDDLYAHEILKPVPYDGVLVSKGIVDGLRGAASAKYSMAQRRRFMSLGGRRFFRLPDNVELMGDCGAFTYRSEEVPPYTVPEVLDFYEVAQVDLAVSVDHVILAFDDNIGLKDERAKEFRRRQEITLTMADEFLRTHKKRKLKFKPLGVAQGWSSASYREALKALQKMGYEYVAVGGMVPLKTPQILASLEAMNSVRRASIGLHLLGITRIDNLSAFSGFGVVSFDSTSPLMQGIKDDDDNYWMPEENYSSVSLPDTEGNDRLRKLITSGRVRGDEAQRLEREAFDGLLDWERRKISLAEVVKRLKAYESLDPTRKDRSSDYRRVLGDRPWEHCECAICKTIGIHVIMKRAAARNRRRGFHNLHVFAQRLQKAESAHQRKSNRKEARDAAAE